MLIPTVRLSEKARQQSLRELRNLLNNVVRFMECPVAERHKLINLWHAQFPQEYIEAWEILSKYGPVPGNGTTHSYIRSAIEIEKKIYYIATNIDDFPPDFPAEQKLKDPLAVLPRLRCAMEKKLLVRVRIVTKTTTFTTLCQSVSKMLFGYSANNRPKII